MLNSCTVNSGHFNLFFFKTMKFFCKLKLTTLLYSNSVKYIYQLSFLFLVFEKTKSYGN